MKFDTVTIEKLLQDILVGQYIQVNNKDTWDKVISVKAMSDCFLIDFENFGTHVFLNEAFRIQIITKE